MSYFSGKNCLVTGGAGFIGTNLINKLLQENVNVRATLYKKDAIIKDTRIEYIKGDLTDRLFCDSIVKDIDYVFMCAANTSGAAVIVKTPLVHVTSNIIMNTQMLEVSYLAKVKKFVFISSSTVYPFSGYKFVAEDMGWQDEPDDSYYGVGWMKRHTEVLCKLYTEKLKPSMQCVVIRPSNIYGPYDKYDFKTSKVMAASIRKVIERHNPIIIWGDGYDTRDFIYIDDFIEGLLKAAQQDTKRFNPYNIVFGEAYNIRKIIDDILEIDKYQNAVVEYDMKKPTVLSKRYISNTKAFNELNFKCEIDIKKGIEKTIYWYKNYYGDNKNSV